MNVIDDVCIYGFPESSEELQPSIVSDRELKEGNDSLLIPSKVV